MPTRIGARRCVTHRIPGDRGGPESPPSVRNDGFDLLVQVILKLENTTRADLRSADLTLADLVFADLSSANLSTAHLNDAQLYGALNSDRASGKRSCSCGSTAPHPPPGRRRLQPRPPRRTAAAREPRAQPHAAAGAASAVRDACSRANYTTRSRHRAEIIPYRPITPPAASSQAAVEARADRAVWRIAARRRAPSCSQQVCLKALTFVRADHVWRR